MGHLMSIIRPQNFFISADGANIKLSNVRGVCKIDHLCRIVTGPNIEINLWPDHGPLEAKLGQSFEGYWMGEKFNIYFFMFYSV